MRTRHSGTRAPLPSGGRGGRAPAPWDACVLFLGHDRGPCGSRAFPAGKGSGSSPDQRAMGPSRSRCRGGCGQREPGAGRSRCQPGLQTCRLMLSSQRGWWGAGWGCGQSSRGRGLVHPGWSLGSRRNQSAFWVVTLPGPRPAVPGPTRGAAARGAEAACSPPEDVLESYENPPPIVLPSEGFWVDLEADCPDDSIYQHLLHVRHFLWGLRNKPQPQGLEVPPAASGVDTGHEVGGRAGLLVFPPDRSWCLNCLSPPGPAPPHP